jgi:dienelactone hydrolase
MRATAGKGGTGAAGGGAGGTGGEKPSQTTKPEVPKDPSKPGPWPVGVRTVSLDLGGGVITSVEVWYPAKPGTEKERQKVSYDLTAWLPPEHGIPASAPKVHIDCDCYRELAPDLDHGPFPVVVVVHGQSSFRAAAASQMTHWASRGFIAIAADHPGLLMRDRLAGNGCSGTGIPQDVTHTRDVPALFRALGQSDGVFSFLKGALDAKRVALAGHGDGAAYAADNGEQPGVKAILSFSDATVIQRAGMVAGAFFLSGQSDKIVPYGNVVRAYENTARGLRPTLLGGMANVGHLGFTDLCGAKNADGQDAIAMARRYNICGGAAVNVADQYFWDCPLSPLAGADNYLDQAATTALVRKLSTLALEELVLGQSHAQEWNDLGADTSWGELRQTR